MKKKTEKYICLIKGNNLHYLNTSDYETINILNFISENNSYSIIPHILLALSDYVINSDTDEVLKCRFEYIPKDLHFNVTDVIRL